MGVGVRRLDDPVAFLEAAEPLLLRDEVRHNLILGLAATLRDHPSLYPEHRLWLIHEDSETIGAALRTPPYNKHRLVSANAGLVLWEDNGPACLASFGNSTPNGMRIGPVYTPPEQRKRGYASALVAQLSAQLLASGWRFCFLHTDLANPTSNAIYERIGYELACKSAEISFELS